MRFSLYLKFHYPNGDFIWTIATHGIITPIAIFVAFFTEQKKAKVDQGNCQAKP